VNPTSDKSIQPAVLPELEHLLVRAARHRAAPRFGRRRWSLAASSRWSGWRSDGHSQDRRRQHLRRLFHHRGPSSATGRPGRTRWFDLLTAQLCGQGFCVRLR
jgi:hypothetical protein